MTYQFQSAKSAFEFIKSYAEPSGDILFVLGQAPEDAEPLMPEGLWHIFLGLPNNTFDIWDDYLVRRFSDSEDNHPFRELTDEQWEELRVMLETLAITQDDWRENHKCYNLCELCQRTGDIGWRSDNEGEKDARFYKLGDALCKDCVSHILAKPEFENHEAMGSTFAHAKKIAQREGIK